MIDEIELPDEGIEEGAPLSLVELGELEDDENMQFDVHGLENGGRRSKDDSGGGTGVGLIIEGGVGGGVDV